MTTARISEHARERCAQMGVSTKIAKRMVREHTCSWTTASGRVVATSDLYPDLTVVYEPQPLVVVTVLYRTQDTYVRPT